MVDADDNGALLALLDWWRQAGVDWALDETPIDWTARSDAAPGAGFAWPTSTEAAVGAFRSSPPGGLPAAAGADGAAPGRPPAERRLPADRTTPDRPAPDRATPDRATMGGVAVPARPKPVGAVAAAARRAVRDAANLDELATMIAAFEGCPLKSTAKSTCVYRGSPSARLMIIGEAPGRDEDLAGKPFVGRAGKLLDLMLAAIGLDESHVHITNVVYWRPPGNRTPTPEEAQACRPFLERQIELVGPEFLLTLGGPAAKAILDVTDGIMRLRGNWREISSAGRPLRVMPTLHPAYLLRQPDAKRQAWRDLLALKMALDAPTQG